MNALAISLQSYFTTFAHTQRDLSVNTIASYRDTWRMVLKHLTATLAIPADALDFDAVTATHVTRSPRSRSTKRRRKRASAAPHSRRVARVGSAATSQIAWVSSSAMRQPNRGSASRKLLTLTRSTPRCVQSK